jgi:hypothetical protein
MNELKIIRLSDMSALSGIEYLKMLYKSTKKAVPLFDYLLRIDDTP